ncbi:MAG TPA: glycosyltransferase family 39 protein, partial [Gammaproteobacteria bacterium]|nr:glycosyltransferase family 39 protein [Gammaproteobacteria bacterium]
MPLLSKLALPLSILLLAAFVYSLYGFNGVLLRDYSIYLYSGQRLAEGVPPYVSVFDHKGPLSPMLAGLGVMLSKWLSWDDLYTVRLVFFAVGCLTVVAVYLLGKNVFRSQAAGFFGALTFLGFYAYAQPAASGPEPKTPMVLFQALSLLLAIWKRWFWAGFFGSLAFLVWQPMGVFALVTFVLAVTRPREERYGAALHALAGIMTPLVATVAYFYYQGALGDFVDGFILFNFLYLIRWDSQLVSVLAGAAGSVALPYGTMIVPIILGLIMIARL